MIPGIFAGAMTPGGGGGGSSKTYWRILITKNVDTADGTISAVAEMRLKTSIGGSNLATGGAASADSEFPDAGLGPANAFDGSNSTFWASGTAAFPHWLAYQLPSPAAVNVVEIVSRLGSWNQTPVTFDVQSSDDGSAWTTEWSVVEAEWTGQNQDQTFARP